eukprot:758254-Hanusia_phi.AAC.1
MSSRQSIREVLSGSGSHQSPSCSRLSSRDISQKTWRDLSDANCRRSHNTPLQTRPNLVLPVALEEGYQHTGHVVFYNDRVRAWVRAQDGEQVDLVLGRRHGASLFRHAQRLGEQRDSSSIDEGGDESLHPIAHLDQTRQHRASVLCAAQLHRPLQQRQQRLVALVRDRVRLSEGGADEVDERQEALQHVCGLLVRVVALQQRVEVALDVPEAVGSCKSAGKVVGVDADRQLSPSRHALEHGDNLVLREVENVHHAEATAREVAALSWQLDHESRRRGVGQTDLSLHMIGPEAKLGPAPVAHVARHGKKLDDDPSESRQDNQACEHVAANMRQLEISRRCRSFTRKEDSLDREKTLDVRAPAYIKKWTSSRSLIFLLLFSQCMHVLISLLSPLLSLLYPRLSDPSSSSFSMINELVSPPR